MSRNRTEYQRQYRAKNRDKLIATSAAWRLNNMERCNEAQKRYYDSNKDKVLAYQAAYRLANPDKIKQYIREAPEKKWRKFVREIMNDTGNKHEKHLGQLP